MIAPPEKTRNAIDDTGRPTAGPPSRPGTLARGQGGGNWPPGQYARLLGLAVEPGVENLVANCPHTGGKLRRPELGVLFQQGQNVGEIVLSLARPTLWLPGGSQLEHDQVFRRRNP